MPEVMVVTYGDKDLEPTNDLEVTVTRSSGYKEKIPGVLINDNVLVVVNDSVFSGDMDFAVDRIESVQVMELSQLPEKWYDKCEKHGKDGIVFIDLKEGKTLQDVASAKNEVKPQAKRYADEKVFMVVEQQPEFPGGMQEMMKYLMKNVKYPTVARNAQTQGRVFVEFIVHKDGSIDDVKAVGGKYYMANKEGTDATSKLDALSNEFKSMLDEYNELEHKYLFATDEKERDAIRSELVHKRDELQAINREIASYLPMEDESISPSDNLIQVLVMNDATMALRDEALRVVESMPAWKPGMQGGKAVAVRMTLPVAFKLQ